MKIYMGRNIMYILLIRIRDEIKFNGLEELINQLKKDKSYAEKNNSYNLI